MKFLKKFFTTTKEVEDLKIRIFQAEKLLSQICESSDTKIPINIYLDIWDFLHPEELNKN